MVKIMFFRGKNKNGSVTVWTLVLGGVFIIILSGILSFLVFQIKNNKRAEVSVSAFHIAEAGVEYSRWRLAHNPEDFDFSGKYDFKDPEGTIVGYFTLQIEAPSFCSPGIKITSTGEKKNHSQLTRTIKAVYAKPSLARFAFLTNSNVWFGPDEALKGAVHSNGGIRMDGEQNSIFSSAKEEYICGSEHGCSYWDCSAPCEWTSNGCSCPGIWGEGEGESEGYWDFPVSNISFDMLIQDLALLKEAATESGIYLPDSGEEGYHIVFLPDGSMDVYKVEELKEKVWGYNGKDWVLESNSVGDEYFYANYDLPSECAPIFAEDSVWVEGEVSGRATLVAARLPDTAGNNPKVVIWDDIRYTDTQSSLGIIGQKDILIPLYSPDNLKIDAALLAQKGRVFRYYYPPWWWEPYKTYSKRDYIETRGSIITNGVWTFTWVKKQGWLEVFESGYETTNLNYDSRFSFSPPPYFPSSGDYEIVKWEEIN